MGYKRGNIGIDSCSHKAYCSHMKSTEIKLRLSEKEKSAWVAEAERVGLKLSEWIRRRCNGTAPQPEVAVSQALESVVLPADRRSSDRDAGDPPSVDHLVIAPYGGEPE